MRCGISGTAAPSRPLTASFAAAALSALFGVAGWWSGSDPAEQAVLIARFTARVSLGFFLVVYLAGPARRDWLAAFVTAHLIHFATMVHLIAGHDVHLPASHLALGLLAYAAPVAALVVPGDPHAGWRLVALDFVWLTFAVTYYHRLFIFPDRRAAGIFAFVLLVLALSGRIGLALRRRRRPGDF